MKANNMKKNNTKKNKGFTLIETIIALLIVSISLTALVGNYGQNARYLHYFKDKTLSELLINNLIVEKRLVTQKIGRTNESIKFGYKTWYWQSVATPFTPVEGILQIDIKVFASKADKDSKSTIQSQKIYVQQ